MPNSSIEGKFHSVFLNGSLDVITGLFFTGRTNIEILNVLEGVHGVIRRLVL